MKINENITEKINLAKFRKEVDSNFLGLAINTSSNYNKDDRHYHRKIIPQRSYHHLASGCVDRSRSGDSGKYSDNHWVINSSKFRIEVDSSFLGLAIDPSSKYKTLDQDSDHHACFQDSSDHTTITTINTHCSGKKRTSPNRKQKINNKRRQTSNSKAVVQSHPEPITPPLELVQIIGNGMYVKDQNRLFVNKREKLLEFLTEEERIRAFGREDHEKPEGIHLIGIDIMGREYKLHLTKWGSLDKPVFNKEWYKLVDANGAKKGDCVHLWGYRHKDDHKFHLAVEFHHQLLFFFFSECLCILDNVIVLILFE
ncbi:hypothetical protein OROHE_000422 [Orobanche hederae]